MAADYSTFHIFEIILAAFTAILASSGFWLYINRKTEAKDCNRRLLLGLAHDRITYLCLKYLEQGNISQDEYENLYEFLYKPYMDVGGNGTAKRLMDEVNKLTIVKNKPFSKKETRYEDVFKR